MLNNLPPGCSMNQIPGNRKEDDYMEQSIVRDAMCYTDEMRELFDAVIEQTGIDWDDIYEWPSDYRDASGGVYGFIYYTETEKFFKDNCLNILKVLEDFEHDIGEPLRKDTENLANWYSWFALEHVMQLIIDYKEGNE